MSALSSALWWITDPATGTMDGRQQQCSVAAQSAAYKCPVSMRLATSCLAKHEGSSSRQSTFSISGVGSGSYCGLKLPQQHSNFCRTKIVTRISASAAGPSADDDGGHEEVCALISSYVSTIIAC